MSLKDAVAARLRKMMGMPGERQKVSLVLDEDTFDICCQYLGEPQHWPITAHYLLEKPDKPQAPNAIYFVHPGADPQKETTSKKVVDDLKKNIETYEKAWIFFATQRSDLLSPGGAELAKFKETVKNTRQLQIAEIEYNVLNFEMEDSRTVVTGHHDAYLALQSEHARLWLKIYMCHVASVVDTLGETPIIHYAKDSPSKAPTHAATELQELLSKKRQNCLSTRIPDHQLRPEGTADVVIVDRSIDPVAPFVLELEYESLLKDVLGDNVGKYGLQTVNSQGRVESVQAEQELLSDKDETWVDIRHSHFQDVPVKLSAAIKAADGTDYKKIIDKGKVHEFTKALEKVKDLPRRKTSLSCHEQMCNKLLAALRNRRLFELAESMENVLIGSQVQPVDFIKRAIESPTSDSGGQFHPEDMVRLLVCCIGGCRSSLDREFLNSWLKHGVNSDIIEQIITNLAPMGVRKTKAPNGSLIIETLQKDLIPRPPPLVKHDWSKRLGQFESYLSNIIHWTAMEKLPVARFDKWNAHLPRSETCLRIGFDWSKRTLVHGDTSVNTRRLIIVLLGGATWGEVRQCHQLAAQLNRNIILITNAVLTPRQWMAMVDPNDPGYHRRW